MSYFIAVIEWFIIELLSPNNNNINICNIDLCLSIHMFTYLGLDAGADTFFFQGRGYIRYMPKKLIFWQIVVRIPKDHKILSKKHDFVKSFKNIFGKFSKNEGGYLSNLKPTDQYRYEVRSNTFPLHLALHCNFPKAHFRPLKLRRRHIFLVGFWWN